MSAAPVPKPSPDVRPRVRTPAVLLMITGGIGVLFALGGLFGEMAGPARPTTEDIMRNPDLPDWLKAFTAATSTKAVGYVMNFLTVSVNAFIAFGGMKMKNLESRKLVLAASIIAILPCFSCFVLGIPVGIWCLVVLSKPGVKEAFHAI